MTNAKRNVWDFPRPPAIEPCKHPVRIEFGGKTIADTTQALMVLETSHPPTYYIPPGDVDRGALEECSRNSYCEWKGHARYYDVVAGDKRAECAVWYYPEPVEAFSALKDYLCFYPSKMDACYVGDEQAQSQPGDFYGGWITSDLEGPFKGAPGSVGW